jgi:hypothetical protein
MSLTAPPARRFVLICAFGRGRLRVHSEEPAPVWSLHPAATARDDGSADVIRSSLSFTEPARFRGSRTEKYHISIDLANDPFVATIHNYHPSIRTEELRHLAVLVKTGTHCILDYALLRAYGLITVDFGYFAAKTEHSIFCPTSKSMDCKSIRQFLWPSPCGAIAT